MRTLSPSVARRLSAEGVKVKQEQVAKSAPDYVVPPPRQLEPPTIPAINVITADNVESIMLHVIQSSQENTKAVVAAIENLSRKKKSWSCVINRNPDNLMASVDIQET